MALTFTLQQALTVPLEVSSVNHPSVSGQSVDQIRSLPVLQGNRQMTVGDFFDVQQTSSDEDLMVWSGDCSRVKYIGSGLDKGRIRVEGNAGMHLGAEMTGGEILVEGDAADSIATEMKGGTVCIKGNAGDLVGAAYPGSKRGMNGGTILVHGNIGNEAGHRMRRGTIVVGGTSGEATGFDMIAGSIFSFGKMGRRLGAGMRRGTIGLFGESDEPELLPTFQYSCVYRPTWLSFFLRELRATGFPVSDDCFESEYRRYCGDFLALGKGEILVRQ
ncbi:formylmethanofuran dehydrogenase subunit C [Gimesia fumaroli]|uniref:Formyltransferase/hydrolase complex Fhc subunit C n=1 Tax=Gimesia fumaroli TaxID=2527976 RepID=A0A518IAL5_9PLAN|nr:formylmethanofuran dehydrogenase subunit C [Gimesia fumaroli]QDV50125.1 Formyltransferase/hydrolase complex Fhc subunit C [Gimesia fumaroli]